MRSGEVSKLTNVSMRSLRYYDKNLMCKDVIMIYEDKLKEVSHQIQILQQIKSRLKERLMKIYHLKEDGINERYRTSELWRTGGC